MTTYSVNASGVSEYKVRMTVTRSGTTVTVKAQWARETYAYSSHSEYATWHIRIDGTDWDGTWSFNAPAGAHIGTTTIATRSKNVGWNGSTDVQVWVDFDVSPGSGHINKQIDVSTTPTAPGTPSLSFDAPQVINADWSNADARGASIDVYNGQTATNSSFTEALRQDVNLPSSKWVIHNAPIGKRVYVRSRAHNKNGWGAWSSSSYYDVPNVPSKPGAPSVSFDAPTSADMSWSAPGNGGASIDQYQVGWDTDDHVAGGTTKTTTSRSYHVTGLTRGKTYYFWVRAHNSQGWGPWSANRTLAVPNVPNVVGTPTVDTVTASSVKITWATPGNNGAGITGYGIQWNTSQSTSGASYVEQGTTRAKTASGLTAGATYYFRVRAKNSQGWGNWSGWRSALTIPGKPTNLHDTEVRVVEATVAWSSPGGGITGYHLQYARSSDFSDATTVTTGSGTRSKTVTDLRPGTDYYWRVRAYNNSGAGAWSSTLTMKTMSGFYTWNGSRWLPTEVYVWNGTEWVECEVYVYRNNAWRVAG